jgi:RHS repeat-associated protein
MHSCKEATSASLSVMLTGSSYRSGCGTGNELLSDGIYNYTYDADGNMTSQTNIATGSVTYYTWDYRNRLVEVKQEDNHNNVLNDERFTYDINNNRIAVSLNGTPQLYTVYDGANPYLDFNGNGQLTERYLYNPHALSQFYGQVNASGNVQWFLTDNIHSIRQVVDSSGNVLDAITYDPYGNIVSQTNAANAPRFLYAGGAYDSNTGIDQFGRRYYISVDGRWLSPDPLGFVAGDTNLYRYVNNSPALHTDPTGLCPPGGCYGPLPPILYYPPGTVPYMPPASELLPPAQATPPIPRSRPANYGPPDVPPGFGEEGNAGATQPTKWRLTNPHWYWNGQLMVIPNYAFVNGRLQKCVTWTRFRLVISTETKDPITGRPGEGKTTIWLPIETRLTPILPGGYVQPPPGASLP